MSREAAPSATDRVHMVAVALCALYVIVLAYPVHRHVVGALSDFYRFYAPDADAIARGEFPHNTYNPPGYPVLLVIASTLTGDHFTSGKWMSLLAGGLVGVLAFRLHRRLFGGVAALLAMTMLLSSATFTPYAVSAMTDIPFVCVCLIAMLVITRERSDTWRSAILSGVVCGVAYLIRYNGLFLLVPGLVGLLWSDGTRTSRLRLAAAFLGTFALTAAPWWWLNYVHHGSPVYSTNHADIVRALGLGGGGRPFTSLADAVLAEPGRFAVSYARNVGAILANSFGASLAPVPLGPLALVGIVASLVRRRQRPVVLVLVGALSFLLLMSLTHWERRYHLVLLASYVGFAAYAIVKLSGWIARALHAPRAARVAAVILALSILVPSSSRAWGRVQTVLRRQPVELLPAARYLDSVASRDATVMAVRAQIAYLSHRQWREPPPADSLETLRGLLRPRPPDYLVHDRWARFNAALATLANADGQVPWLRPIYRDPAAGVVIYAVELPRE